MQSSRAPWLIQKHCRCTAKACGRRFKGSPGVSLCPVCARVCRLDRWADSKPWRRNTCYCDRYLFPHRLLGGACLGPLRQPDMPGIVGLPF